MLEPLAWDSMFFKRRIGTITGPWTVDGVAADVAAARTQRYDYLTSRPPMADGVAVRAVEQSGFYLTDVGVTWSTGVEEYLHRHDLSTAAARVATDGDLAWLRLAATTLFVQSRFYHDPFYPQAAADRMHVAWLENSVRGIAADAVWVLPGAGLVTCKVSPDGAGQVVLIGVLDGAQRRGVGRTLMTAALRWFHGRAVRTVMVKTQVKNLKAMNFYRRLGFTLHGADLTFGCLLSGARAE